MGKFVYYLIWAFKVAILKKKVPLNSSIILTDKCNLNCRHCTVANLGYKQQNLNEIRRGLEMLYATGSRMLVITGGEPLLWYDDVGHTVENVVSIAKDMGFFRIVICTNGTLPLVSKADYLWVSLDGYEEQHNQMRGAIYNKIVNNITASSHKRIYINFTICTNNYNTFSLAAEQILSIRNVRGILFHLYTPYIGGDNTLMLNTEHRKIVLRQLGAFKFKHPIATFNTFAGISAMQKDNWERPTWASVTINQGHISDCCCRLGIYNEEVCTRCGCSPAVETWVLQTFKISALLESLRYL